MLANLFWGFILFILGIYAGIYLSKSEVSYGERHSARREVNNYSKPSKSALLPGYTPGPPIQAGQILGGNNINTKQWLDVS